MATFGRDLNVFEQIAGGNLQALRELVSSTNDLVKQPVLPTDFGGAKPDPRTGPGAAPNFTIDKPL
jgi:hypothetical protein